MKKFSKGIVAALAALVCCGAAGACGKENVKTTALEIWTYYNDAQNIAFTQAVADFNATVGKQKRIRINHSNEKGVNELAAKIEKAVAGEVGAPEKPAMFQSYVDDLWALDDKHAVVAELDDYFTEAELARFVPGYLEEGRFGNGTLKLIPIAKSTECFLMNKDAWDEFAAGRTDVSLDMLATMEGLVRVAGIYYGETGKAFFGRDAMANYVLVGARALGQEIITYDGDRARVNLDRAAFRTLYDNYYVPYVKGWFGSYGSFRSNDVKLQKLVAYIGSTASVTNFPDEVSLDDDRTRKIECYAATAPRFEGDEFCAIQQGAGIAVMRSDPATERACCEFLKYLTESERNTRMAVDMKYLPVVRQNDALTSMKDALVREKWTGEAPPTAAEREEILAAQAKYVRVYETALATAERATMWASKPTRVSALLRKVFDVCIQGDKSRVNAPALDRLVNAEDLRALIQEGAYTGTPEAYFDTWFAQLQAVVNGIVGVELAA